MNVIIGTRIILIIEVISFFLQYTFGLSRNYASVFDMVTFCMSVFIFMNISISGNEYIWKKKCTGLIVILVVISSFYNIDTFGFGSIMTIGRFLLYYLIVNYFYIDRKIKVFIITLAIMQIGLLQVVDVSSYNTNTIGIVYLILGVLIALLVNPKRMYSKMFYFGLYVLLIYLIYLSNTRSCLIAYIFFLIMHFLPITFYRKKYILLLSVLALTIGSLFYVNVYVYLWQNSIIDSEIITETVENTGKDFFSGRQKIWEECLNLLHNNPFWGCGSKIRLYSFRVVNLHNSMLNFFVIYGSIVGFCVIYLISRTVYEFRPYVYNKKVHDCLSAFLAFLVVSVFETNLLVFSFISLMPLMIANSTIRFNCLAKDMKS